jgi:hypothetical protein
MAKGGKIAARITFDATQTATFTDTSGAAAVSVPAGNYYPEELIAAIDADLDADWTITLSDGEGLPSAATGRVTINSTLTPWSITWATTPMRDALGFTGNVVGVSAAQTGTNHYKGLWLPGVQHKSSMYGDSAGGSIVGSFRSMKSQTGIVSSIASSYHRVHRDIRWDGIPAQRAMAHHESVSGESFESFYLDCVTARLAYLPVSAPVRLYWDADVDATYAVGRLQWPANFDLEQFVPGWVGRYRVTMPPLVVEV